MNYSRFMLYNVVGGVVWVSSFMSLGYYFGNLEFIQSNFKLVTLAIIIISIIPGLVEWLKAYRESRQL